MNEKLRERLEEIDQKAIKDMDFLEKKTFYRKRIKEIEKLRKELNMEERLIRDALKSATNRRFRDNLIIPALYNKKDKKSSEN